MKKSREQRKAEKIGNNIRRLRMGKMMYQLHLANKAGIDQARLSDYEKNKRVPSYETLEALAAALQVDVNEFYNVGK